MTEVDALRSTMPSTQKEALKHELHTKLDHLLEQYLNTLDAYEKAHVTLTADMSSGFMSLAEANFHNHNHTRFGQDYYDERMQASRQVSLKGTNTETTLSIRTRTKEPPLSKNLAEETVKSTEIQHDLVTEPEKSETSGEARKEGFEGTDSEHQGLPSDPLRWFGILVPQALRSSQSAFVSAVEGPIPQLSTLAKNLRETEIEIGRVKKQIQKLSMD